LGVFSGILGSQAEMALAVLGRHGFGEVRRREAGEWVAFLTEIAT
jgi:ribosomal protein L11 methylase PrmA